MAFKINYLFFLYIFSLFLFANSLKFKESSSLRAQVEEEVRAEDKEADKEASNELKFGMAQDWDNESLSELQLEDSYTKIADTNSNFLEAPKHEKKTVLALKNSEEDD